VLREFELLAKDAFDLSRNFAELDTRCSNDRSEDDWGVVKQRIAASKTPPHNS